MIDCLFDPPNRRPEHVLTHQCLGRRVLHPIIASLSSDPEPECRPPCPLVPNVLQLPAPCPGSPDVYVVDDDDKVCGQYFAYTQI
jgi:hypothetical protein